MDKLLVITLLISSFNTIWTFDHHGYHNHEHSEENCSYEDYASEEKTQPRSDPSNSSNEETYQSGEESSNNQSASGSSTTQPITTLRPGYEVTEIVDDIPNNETIAGPIVANFTLSIPLNNATIVTNKTNTSSKNNTGNNTKYGKNPTENKEPNLRKTSFSILHVKGEYDNDKPDVIIQNVTPSLPNFQGFKDYLYGFKKGIVNGLQSFGNKDKEPTVYVGNSPQVSNVVSAPVIFWNQLQKRSSDVAAKLHKAIFGGTQVVKL